MKALGVLVLRFRRIDQEYKTPLNVTIGGREWPIGLIATTLALFFIAIANLFTKQIATVAGIAFSLLLFAVFTISEPHECEGTSVPKRISITSILR